MRELWVKVPESLSDYETKALIKETSSLCTAYIIDPVYERLARNAGAKTIVTSKEGDILLVDTIDKISSVKRNQKKAVCIVITVQSKIDEEKIIKAAEASSEYIVVRCFNWKVIPLENLIANIHGKSKLLAFASSDQEAKLVLETLEIGVDGVVVELSDIEEIKKIYDALKSVKTRVAEKEAAKKITLLHAKVVGIKALGSGARVCVDTCDIMKDGEGILVGCQSSGLFLIQAEVYENPFVAPRPFRVNAGPAALYVITSGGKTKYLSELKAGDEVLIVDRQGKKRIANICRVKTEWRPLVLIEAEYKGKKMKTIVQNAETIRVMTKDGSKSVKDLKCGDEVLVHMEEGGRHFGTLVKEERVIES